MQLGTDLSGSHLSPRGSLTAARTLLEIVCKHILDDCAIAYVPGTDVLKLYRLTTACLQLSLSPEYEKLVLELADQGNPSFALSDEKDRELAIHMALVDGAPATQSRRSVVVQANKLADLLLKTHLSRKAS